MGVGVTAGSMLITDKNGSTGTITLTIADDTTVGDILTQINDQASTAGLDVTATVNDTGDGIQLLDTSGGVGSLTVAESGGTTAKDLNLLGTSTSTTLDGSFEYKITVDATDTLSDVALEINNLNRGVAASVLNDGNSTNPYRLNLVSRVSGSAGRMTVNSDISGMNFSTSSRAQDSVLLLGSTSGGTSPMALINSSNTVSDAIPGVTLNLKSVSTSPVTISVSKDTSGIQKQVESFVTAVNNALSEISDLTSFDASTMDKGVLFGEQAPLTIKNSLIRTLTSTLKGDSLSGYTRLSQIGLSFNSDGELELDADKLTTALTTDPESVKSLFTGIAEKATSATQVSKINNGAGFTTLSDTGADLEITTHDGSSYQIDISGLSMMQQIIDKINSDTGGKVTAKIGSDGYRLQLVDNTTGTTSFSVADYNGSTAATDLKISRSTTEATITGTNLFLEKTTKGIAEQYTALLTNITDASSGTIYHQTNSLASQITSLNETITKMEARLEAKQARLEAQFTAMETAMSSLQTQQSALDQMFGTSSSSSSSSSS